MTLSLRPYQADCVAAIWRHVQASPAPAVAVLPTGAGKSLVLAQLAKDVVGWNGRIVILAHVKELVQQNYEEIQRLAPELAVGVYSAGLKSRDVGYPVTVAGIQSVYNKAEVLGPADVIVVDEAHRIPPDGDGQYRTFLDAARKLNTNVRLIGLTATPFRTQSGFIYGRDQLFERSVYDVGVRRLIVDSFLSPILSKTTADKAAVIDTENVRIEGGEFKSSDLQAAATADPSKVCQAIVDICTRTAERRSVLVFCAGVEHAKQVAGFLREMELGEVREIYGSTSDEDRDQAVRDFREGRVKFMVNVDVLTTGFNAPNVDAIAMLRPTMSAGLYCQMVGRGLRKASGKVDCIVLDYSGNIMRHGPIDRMILAPDGGPASSKGSNPWKECPDCLEVLPRTAGVCLACGHQFPKPERREKAHDGTAANANILNEPEQVVDIDYTSHTKRDAPEGHPPTMRVTYDYGGFHRPSEFLCFQHPPGSFAQRKAAEWWRARSDQPVPASIEEALAAIYEDNTLFSKVRIKQPGRIVLAVDGKYLRVVKGLDLELRDFKKSLREDAAKRFETAPPGQLPGPGEDVPF